MPMEVEYGRTRFSIEVPTERLIPMTRAQVPTASADPATAVAQAIAQPTRFPPLHQAFTPDDNVALVIDPALPDLEVLVAPILAELARAQLLADRVTVIVPPSAPDDFAVAGLKVERHDPTELTRRCYVANTKSSQRIYLNRTMVESDQIIVLSEVRYADRDAIGGPALFYPSLAEKDAEAITGDAEEIARLVGLPFFIHVIAGPGGSVGQVIAGPAETYTDAQALLKSCWTARTPQKADLVIATMAGDPQKQSLDELLNALYHARRMLNDGGAIALLTESVPALGDAFTIMRACDSPEAAWEQIRAEHPEDEARAGRWLKLVRDTRVLLLSGWAEDLVEDMFATALQHARQVQRLIDAGGDVLIMPDAHRLRVGLEKQP